MTTCFTHSFVVFILSSLLVNICFLSVLSLVDLFGVLICHFQIIWCLKTVYFSEVAQLLIDEENADFICLRLFQDCGKLNVLPLLAEVATSSYDYKVKFLTEESCCKRLIAAAGSDIDDLKFVIEILYNVTDYNTIIAVFPNLLAKAKLHWQDEGVMYGIIKMLSNIQENCDDHVNEKIGAIGILSTISVLCSLLFSKKPSSMGLEWTFDFPRNLWEDGFSIYFLLVDAVYNSVSRKGCPESSKIIRPIIPIISFVLEEISKHFNELVKEFPVRQFLRTSANLVLLFVHQKCDFTREKDLKILINSKMLERFLTLFEKSSPDKCCYTGLRGMPEDCIQFKCAAMDLLMLFSGSKVWMLLSTVEKIDLLKIIKRMLVNRRIFGPDGAVEGYDIICILVIFETIKTQECLEFVCDPQNGMLSTIIEFGSKNSHRFNFVSLVFDYILTEIGLEELHDHVVTLPAMCLNHLIHHSDFTANNPKPLEYSISTLNANNNVANLNLFGLIICSASLPQLYEMNNRFSVIELMISFVKKCKNSYVILAMLENFNELLNKHQLSFLDAKYLSKIIPVIWNKCKIFADVKEIVMLFTFQTSLLMPSSFRLDYADFLPLIWGDVNELSRLKPQSPGLLRIIWELVKRPHKKRQHKILFKKLLQLSSDKTVEYASPGKTDLAKIFKFISDLIIAWLERDPPCETEHLIDLTQCMIGIATACTLDEELYVLEDLVSPAMWLLEKQDDEKIVANVKEFINILH